MVPTGERLAHHFLTRLAGIFTGAGRTSTIQPPRCAPQFTDANSSPHRNLKPGNRRCGGLSLDAPQSLLLCQLSYRPLLIPSRERCGPSSAMAQRPLSLAYVDCAPPRRRV